MKYARKYAYDGFHRETVFADDFHKLDATVWSNAATGGTVATQDGPGGQILIDTAAATTDNCLFMYTATKYVQPGVTDSGEAIRVECRVKFTEQSTNNANILFGITSTAVSTGMLVGSSGGLVSPYFGAALMKLGGTTVWQATSSDGTAAQRTNNVSNQSSINTQWQRLIIELEPVGAPTATSASQWRVNYFVNDTQLIDTTTLRQISHTINNPTAANLAIVLGIKNGAGAREKLTVDSIVTSQPRLLSV